MSNVVTFDGAPPPGTINLAIGQPSADMLPTEIIRDASDAFFKDAQALEFNYGVTQGDERFLDSLSGFLHANYGAPAPPEQLFTTAGNSQALDLAAVCYAQPGDTVFVEEPSYFLAFQILRDHGLNIVGIAMDDDGPSIEALRTALEQHSPALLYTIPSYHNPGGQCTSLSRRLEILALANEHDFLIVADEVYQLLHYYDPPPPAYGTMADSNRVVSLGSFSKILAPGMRLGWIQTSPQLREKLMASGFVNSGGSINHFSSHIVRHAIDNGSLDAHVKILRNAYRSRVEAMHASLNTHFHGLATWRRPDGGYFFWLRFHESVDTSVLREQAGALQTGFQSGAVFSSKGALSNYVRLSFSHYDEADIEEGIKRMRPLFDNARPVSSTLDRPV